LDSDNGCPSRAPMDTELYPSELVEELAATRYHPRYYQRAALD